MSCPHEGVQENCADHSRMTRAGTPQTRQRGAQSKKRNLTFSRSCFSGFCRRSQCAILQMRTLKTGKQREKAKSPVQQMSMPRSSPRLLGYHGAVQCNPAVWRTHWRLLLDGAAEVVTVLGPGRMPASVGQVAPSLRIPTVGAGTSRWVTGLPSSGKKVTRGAFTEARSPVVMRFSRESR